MKFEYIAYGLLAITAIFVLINLLIGLLRGTKKTLGFLVSIAVSAIIAAVVTLTVCTPTSSLMAVLMGYVQDFLASQGDTLADIFAISEVGDAMAYYVAMIVAPLLSIIKPAGIPPKYTSASSAFVNIGICSANVTINIRLIAIKTNPFFIKQTSRI